MSNINDFIHGGAKIPSATFSTPGDKVVGTIVEFDVSQVRKFGTNEPETWDDGKPKEQLVVTLQTDENTGSDDDTGQRRLYAKKPSNLLSAIADALTETGAELKVGGRLAVVFTGTKPHERPGFNPIKEYKAAYEAPANGQAASLLADAGTTTQQAATNPSHLL